MSSRPVTSFQDQLMQTLRGIQSENNRLSRRDHGNSQDAKDTSFFDQLKSTIDQVNSNQISADRMSMELSTGQTNNIHETMLKTSQAELSFNLLVQIRNKALEAYNEIMRMPV